MSTEGALATRGALATTKVAAGCLLGASLVGLVPFVRWYVASSEREVDAVVAAEKSRAAEDSDSTAPDVSTAASEAVRGPMRRMSVVGLLAGAIGASVMVLQQS